MLKLFAQNSIGQAFILLIVTLLLWAKGFFMPVAMPLQDGFAPLYSLLYNWLSPHSLLSTILALLLVLVEGIWLCTLLYNHKMLPCNTFLPLLFFLIAMSYHHSMLTLTPMLICNLFILLCSQQLLHGENKNLPPERIFNTTLFISIATLFYMPAILLLVPFFIIVTTYQLYRWRDWVVMLLGFIAPYILLVTFYYLTDRVDYMLYLMGNDFAHIQFSWQQVDLLHTIADVFIILLMTWSILSKLGTTQEGTTDFRRQSTIMLTPALGALLMLFCAVCFPFNTQLFAIPFSFAASLLFLNAKRQHWLYNTLLVIAIVFGTAWF